MMGPVHQIIERTEAVLNPNVIIFYLWLLSKYPDGADMRTIASGRDISKRSVYRKVQFLEEIGYLERSYSGRRAIYKPVIKNYMKVAS